MARFPCWPFSKRLECALQVAAHAGCPAVGLHHLPLGEDGLFWELKAWMILQVQLLGFLPQGRLLALFAPSGAEVLEADVLVFLGPPLTALALAG